MNKNVIRKLTEPKQNCLTIRDLLLTVKQVLADAGRVLAGAQWLLDALDHITQVVQCLEDV